MPNTLLAHNRFNREPSTHSLRCMNIADRVAVQGPGVDGIIWRMENISLLKVRLEVKLHSSLCRHLRATGCHLSYEMIQCYLPPDTGDRALPTA